MLVSDMIGIIRESLSDVRATRWTDSQIIYCLNEAIKEVNFSLHLFKKEYRTFVDNNTEYLERPGDCYLVTKIFLNNKVVNILSIEDAEDSSPTWILDMGNLQSVVIDYMPSNGIRFYPIPIDIVIPEILNNVSVDISKTIPEFGICLDFMYPQNYPSFGLVQGINDILFDTSTCDTITVNEAEFVECANTNQTNYGGVITDIISAEECSPYGAVTEIVGDFINSEDFGAITGLVPANVYMLYVAKPIKVNLESDILPVEEEYKTLLEYYASYRLLENDVQYQDLRASELKYKRYLAELAKFRKDDKNKNTTGRFSTPVMYKGFV